MNLQTELHKLQPLIGKNNEVFEKQINSLFENFSSEEEKEIITNFIMSELNKSGQIIDDFIEETKVKIQLMEVAKVVSLSYIAKNYFNKTRNWLYQKINGSIVNGKQAQFTDEEINTLNFALQDISKKIGSTVISL
jgi:hypothetical protein